MPKNWMPLWLAVAMTAAASQAARAQVFTLDFGGLQDGEQVLSYYDGGFGSLGSGPGSDYGITFTTSFLAVMAVPPYGPDRVGQLNGSSAIMDIEGGFTNLLSFYYEASDNSGLVTIWSGPDGTGSMLSNFTLTAAGDWSLAGGTFPGIAESVVFSGTPGMRFDQITNVGLVVPEPSSLPLLGTGLVSLAAAFRRRESS